MEILILPLMILNMLGGAISGVWLLAVGEWQIVAIGLFLTIGGMFFVSILLLPSIVLVAPITAAVSQTERQPSRMSLVVLGVLSVGYTYLAMGFWVISIFFLFHQLSDYEHSIPVVLWCYAAGTSVWAALAQKDMQSGNFNSGTSLMFHQIGCVLVGIYFLMQSQSVTTTTSIVLYAIPMSISLIYQVSLFVQANESHR